MKFRCERDTLAEAVATAQRAVASRTARCRCSRICGSPRRRRSLELVGSDLELTNRVQVPAEVDDDGHRGRPGRLFSRDRAQARGRDRDGRADRRRGARSRPGGSRPRCDCCRPTSSRGCPSRRGRACGSTRRAFAEALRQVVRAASKDDPRPILTGVLLTAHAGGLRLVATDSYRLAVRDLQGVSMLERGPEGARRGQGPGRGAAAARRRRRDRGRAAASARSCSARRHRRGHRPADRGRVPELRAADPERLPEPAHRVARRAAGRRSTACGSSGRAATPRRCGSR